MQHRESFRTDGLSQSIGPFPFLARGVLVINRTSVDAQFFDDAGFEYDAPAHVAATYPLAVPTTRLRGGLIVAKPATDPGSLQATVTDAATILSTAQLSTITLSQSVIQYVGSAFPATVQPDGTVIAYTPDTVNFPSVVWLLRFNATTGWWEGLGRQTPLIGLNLGSNTNGVTVNAWVNVVGSVLVIPRQGDYLCEGGGVISPPAIGSVQAALYANTAPNFFDPHSNESFTANEVKSFVVPPFRANGRAAGDTIGVAINSTVANAIANNIGWSVEPVRVK